MWNDVFWYMIMPLSGEVALLAFLVIVSVLLHRWQRLRREHQEEKKRLAAVRRKCACQEEGRLCARHSAEIIAELREKRGVA